MPELPDLEVVREFLTPRIENVAITAAQIRRPIVVRNLLGGDAADQLAGRAFSGVARRGKFLLLHMTGGAVLVIHPMLAGRIRYGEPLKRHRVRDVLVLRLSDGRELRYHDAKDMGKVYMIEDLDQIPNFSQLGPEAIDPNLTLDVFCDRLRRQRDEIKRILTTQTFVAGIGSAYADEICWRACLYPFRRRANLNDSEIKELHGAMQAVLREAISTLRTRVGDAIDIEVRDFLAVHGKAGQPCVRCGNSISRVTRSRSTTNFCRGCQPGLMVGG